MRQETQSLRTGKLPYPEIETNRVLETIKIARANPGWFFAAVAETDQIVGMMGGSMSLWAFSSKYIAQENNIYVIPEARGTRAGYLLMKAFEKWGRENNADYFRCGVYTGMESVSNFYQRLGYEHIGTDYIKCAVA